MAAFFSVCLALVAVASASHHARNAKLIDRDTALKTSYDFIVVGGGTSGLTVANRLIENSTGGLFSSMMHSGELIAKPY